VVDTGIHGREVLMITPREYANRATAWRQVFTRLYQQARAKGTYQVSVSVPLTVFADDCTQLIELCEYVIEMVEKGEDNARLRSSARQIGIDAGPKG
jgi:hypothetical protein